MPSVAARRAAFESAATASDSMMSSATLPGSPSGRLSGLHRTASAPLPVSASASTSPQTTPSSSYLRRKSKSPSPSPSLSLEKHLSETAEQASLASTSASGSRSSSAGTSSIGADGDSSGSTRVWVRTSSIEVALGLAKSTSPRGRSESSRSINGRKSRSRSRGRSVGRGPRDRSNSRDDRGDQSAGRFMRDRLPGSSMKGRPPRTERIREAPAELKASFSRGARQGGGEKDWSDWGWISAVLLDASQAGRKPSSNDDGATSESNGAVLVRVADPSCPFDEKVASLHGGALQDGDVLMANDHALAKRGSSRSGGQDDSKATKQKGLTSSSPYSNNSFVPMLDTNSEGSTNSGKQNHPTTPHNRSSAPFLGLDESHPDDLITLTHLHEPAVVHSLRYRYARDEIYTNTGPVLLALNPFKTIRGLYSESTMRRYWEESEGREAPLPPGTAGGLGMMKKTRMQELRESRRELPPHVYGIADRSFRDMLRGLDDQRGSSLVAEPTAANVADQPCADQSILVSGESGSGKTVTVKIIMRYLAVLSQRCATSRGEGGAGGARSSGGGGRRTPSPTIFLSSRGGGGHKSETSVSATSNQTSWAAPGFHGLRETAPPSPGILSDASNVIMAGALSSDSSSDRHRNSIEGRVLQSNPILESFGNARTVRNDNSSRFGKYIEMSFAESGGLVGASIETYLLEKVRLVRQSNGERNYHVFYEMLAGFDRAESEPLHLADMTPADFRLTNQSGVYTRRDGVQDRDMLRSLRSAMDVLRFEKEEQFEIFAVAAAVLHAGNLMLREVSGAGTDPNTSEVVRDDPHLDPLCDLLAVSVDDLDEAICHYHIQAGRDGWVRVSLDVEKARKGVEALIKALFGALFNYLVRRINGSINRKRLRDGDKAGEEEADGCCEEAGGDAVAAQRAYRSSPAAVVGVLDIFGFESFESNSFEQFCINYANESLQQQFNAFLLRNEQREYEREGIDWSFISFPENQDVLDLIDARNTGILSALDDQCRAPGASDKSFAAQVYVRCKGHDRFDATHAQVSDRLFEIRHYAGSVEYDIDGFVEKNRDELPKEAAELLMGSGSAFVRELAEDLAGRTVSRGAAASPSADSGGAEPYQFRRSDSSLNRVTVGGQFSRQLRNLRSKIDRTTPHYIRCLKPNDNLEPEMFDPVAIAEQLKCGGVLEAVRVSRAGYAQHYRHRDFYRRYRVLGALRTRDQVRSWDGAAAGGNGGGAAKASGGGDPTRQQCEELVGAICRKIIGMEEEERRNMEEEMQRQKKEEKEEEAQSEPLPVPSWKQRAANGSGRTGYGGDASPKFVPPSPEAWSNRSRPTKASSFSNNRIPPSTSTPTNKYRWETESSYSRKSHWPVARLNPTDLTRVGLQMGKTKVFLRHAAFETLERMRSRTHAVAATQINALARMRLARKAYIPRRNAYRRKLAEMERMTERQEFDPGEGRDPYDYSPARMMIVPPSVSGGISPKRRLHDDDDGSSTFRHSYTGKIVSLAANITSPREPKNFKWVFQDGRWTRNEVVSEVELEEDIDLY